MSVSAPDSICIVAIIKNEDQFLEEWIAYHLIIGIGHFFLYDDGSDRPLDQTLVKYASCVTVVPWNGNHESLAGRNRQTKAYLHATHTFTGNFQWTAFIDCDEFIVIKNHSKIQDFLAGFENAGCICLNWHFFGHSGFYDYPQGLITASLTRRRAQPGNMVKSICRSNIIIDILSAHFCSTLGNWLRVDANNNWYSDSMYPGKTEKAHINHYYCRSFLAWRNRVLRGDPAFDSLENLPQNQLWRFNELENLKKFVTTVAVFDNEYHDDYMLQFTEKIQELISIFNSQETLPRPITKFNT